MFDLTPTDATKLLGLRIILIGIISEFAICIMSGIVCLFPMIMQFSTHLKSVERIAAAMVRRQNARPAPLVINRSLISSTVSSFA